MHFACLRSASVFDAQVVHAATLQRNYCGLLQRNMPKTRAARCMHETVAMRFGKMSDGSLGILLATIGIAMMSAAVLSDKQPFAALPGMDGAMTAGTLGFILALLHGLSFRHSLQLMAPVVCVQVIGSTYHQCNIVALIGLELGIYGLVGMAASWFRDVRAEQLARLRRERKACRRGAKLART